MIDLNAASKAELTAYAEDELGLTVAAKATVAEIKTLIEGEIGSDEIIQKADTPQGEKSLGGKVAIRILENEKHPPVIFVGVNGISYGIKPGEVVNVPQAVVKVLDNAVETRYKRTEDKATGAVTMTAQQVKSYPYELV